jgi:glycosyltransferase involved in cell wall biosynthesis
MVARTILLLSDVGGLAGSTQSVASLAIHLRARGHAVWVGRRAGEHLDALCLDAGLARPALDFSSTAHLAASVRALDARVRFDVVNPQATRDRRACALLRWQGALRRPLVVTRRTMPLTWFPELVAIGYTADRTIAVSDAVRAALRRRGHPDRGLRVVPNGIRLDRVDAPPSPEADAFAERVLAPLAPRPIVLMVARRKDQGVLLAALARVTRPVAVVFAGIHADAELARLAAALPDRHAVRFLGPVADPLPLYRRATVAVLPSRIEGLSQALLEAMALGVPVLASAAGGNPDLLTDDATGWLLPPLDASAWAHRLEAVLADGARRARVGAAGRQLVRTRYTLEATAERTEAVYEEVLADHEARTA